MVKILILKGHGHILCVPLYICQAINYIPIYHRLECNKQDSLPLVKLAYHNPNLEYKSWKPEFLQPKPSFFKGFKLFISRQLMLNFPDYISKTLSLLKLFNGFLDF